MRGVNFRIIKSSEEPPSGWVLQEDCPVAGIYAKMFSWYLNQIWQIPEPWKDSQKIDENADDFFIYVPREDFEKHNAIDGCLELKGGHYFFAKRKSVRPRPSEKPKSKTPQPPKSVPAKEEVREKPEIPDLPEYKYEVLERNIEASFSVPTVKLLRNLRTRKQIKVTLKDFKLTMILLAGGTVPYFILSKELEESGEMIGSTKMVWTSWVVGRDNLHLNGWPFTK